MKLSKIQSSVIAVGALALAGTADATGLDMSGVTGAVDVSTVITAISALAVIKVGPGFAKWAYNKVIDWFGGR
jgi:hypothetical protein